MQVQAIVGTSLFGSPVPTSFLQPFIPRPELHLVYNLIVFIPMIVAMWLHSRPAQDSVNDCNCATPGRPGPGRGLGLRGSSTLNTLRVGPGASPMVAGCRG